MATIQTKVDDVLYALKGQKVEATSTRRVQVPGVAFRSSKARGFTIDVSPAGERELDKALKAAEEASVKAWEAVLRICGTDADTLQASATGKAAKEDADTPDQGASESGHEEHGGY